ncbi:MAG: DEAD/DEAH box helicase [Thiothrix sp.]|nr:DEAD/DEAH box helicase [Thiothrix sp.]HPQ94797.1 DEAD/DEAH box helicase [Thiolinea sp.]
MSDNAPQTPDPLRFTDLALAPAILQAIQAVGYETPSPIQAESIPPLLEGRDLLGQAQTGTGKTAAFALPLLSRLNLDLRAPQLLVLTPTRELAIQVAEAIQRYAHYLPGFQILPIYGGQGMGLQLRQLERGVHVVVGTPGRVLDHLGRGSLKLEFLKAAVLDEADEMLRMGFIDDVDQILSHTPEQKQVALFSATMPPQIRRIAMRHLHEPVEIKIASKTSTVESINQRYWEVRGVGKLDALTRMLEVADFDALIIFVRTKTSTEELADRLQARGFASAALNGDLNQQQREKTIERLRNGQLDIVVATDVAARGLDVPRISHVVNFDIPYDTESYVHRIGRTGRAGRTGEAILFVAPREKRMLYAIERATGQRIAPMKLPTRSEIAGHRINQFKQTVMDALASDDLDFFRGLVLEMAEEQGQDMVALAASMAWLLQRDQPLQPEMDDEPDLSERGSRRERGDRGERGGRNERGGRGRHNERMVDEASREPPVDMDMCTYRIEVGRAHEVEPKHIVGAIANEIGLDSEYIQAINIHDDFTLLDLPDGMPKDVMQHLKNVWVKGRKLMISVDRGRPPARGERDEQGGRSRKREGTGRDGPSAGVRRADGAGRDRKPGARPTRNTGAGRPGSAGKPVRKGRK